MVEEGDGPETMDVDVGRISKRSVGCGTRPSEEILRELNPHLPLGWEGGEVEAILKGWSHL